MARRGTNIRVLVADDRPIVAAGVGAWLCQQAGIKVIGAFSLAETAAQFRELRPDVVLVGHPAGAVSPPQVIDELRRSDEHVQVLVVADDDSTSVAASLAAGAAGFVFVTDETDTVLECLHRAARGEAGLDARATSRLQAIVAGTTTATASVLSKREREVLTLVAQGNTNPQIARALFVSPETVKTHLARLYAKLKVRDRAAAVAVALKKGIIDIDD